MPNSKSPNAATLFCFGAAALIIAAAVMGYAVNHTVEAGTLAGLLIVEGLLIEEATLDGLFGLGFFYLATGVVTLVAKRFRRSDKAASEADTARK